MLCRKTLRRFWKSFILIITDFGINGLILIFSVITSIKYGKTEFVIFAFPGFIIWITGDSKSTSSSLMADQRSCLSIARFTIWMSRSLTKSRFWISYGRITKAIYGLISKIKFQLFHISGRHRSGLFFFSYSCNPIFYISPVLAPALSDFFIKNW